MLLKNIISDHMSFFTSSHKICISIVEGKNKYSDGVFL